MQSHRMKKKNIHRSHKLSFDADGSKVACSHRDGDPRCTQKIFLLNKQGGNITLLLLFFFLIFSYNEILTKASNHYFYYWLYLCNNLGEVRSPTFPSLFEMFISALTLEGIQKILFSYHLQSRRKTLIRILLTSSRGAQEN